MDQRLFSTRDLVVWTGCFLAASALLVLTGFTSVDGDSQLYADLAGRLTREPMARWVAPEWWGFWNNSTGLFREHPAGVLWLPAFFARIGVPAVQGAYIQGLAAEIGSLLLIGVLVRRVTTVAHARTAMLLMLVMPVAFIFRIRANHEYPMLCCLALTLVALDNARRSARWIAVAALAMTAALLAKGVFVVLVIIAAGLWALANPTRQPGSLARPIAAIAAGLVVMALTALAYDAWYQHVTGDTFWGPYWRRQLGPVTIATPLTGAAHGLENLGAYLLRILWHPAPWSFAILAGAWRFRGNIAALRATLTDRERRALIFGGVFVAAVIGLLFPLSRFAERYAFSATWTTAAIGAVVAISIWPPIRTLSARIQSNAPTAIAWLVLVVLRLLLGPVLPRLQW